MMFFLRSAGARVAAACETPFTVVIWTVIFVSGSATPNSCSYSTMDLMRVGFMLRSPAVFSVANWV